MENKKVVVIGGGAAGMIAAVAAAKHGAAVVILEKKERLGIKLSITGKGRCNITNDCDRESFIKNMPGNGRFLYSAYSAFSKEALMDFFTTRGLPLKVERGARVFPDSDKALDVVDVLQKELAELKVRVIYGAIVKEVFCKEICAQNASVTKTVNGVLFDRNGKQEQLAADSIIIATGGISYPATGSTGDGYKIAAMLGHNVIKPHPSLVPLEIAEEWIADLQGLSLKNVNVSLLWKGKKIAEEFGEMIFTHFGVSGPIILSLSRYALPILEKAKMDGAQEKLILEINFKPALSEETLNNRLKRDILEHQRRLYKNVFEKLLPQKMIDVFVKISGIDSRKFVHQVTKQERLSIVQLFQHFCCTVKGARPIAEAIVTAGGVSVKEIEPASMQSKLIKGLYFAGEVIDIDGFTGGFNLQAAFSTGYVAGVNSASV